MLTDSPLPSPPLLIPRTPTSTTVVEETQSEGVIVRGK